MQHLKREYNELDRHYKELLSKLTRCEQAIVKHNRKHTALQIEVQTAEENLDRLQDALTQENIEEGHLEALRANLQEVQDEKNIHEASYQDSVNEIDKSRETVKELGEQLQAIRQAVAESETRANKADATAERLSSRREAALYATNEAHQRIEDAKRDKGAIEAKLQTIIARVEDFAQKAGKVSPRVTIDAGETPDSLEKKLDRLHRELDEYQRQCVCFYLI